MKLRKHKNTNNIKDTKDYENLVKQNPFTTPTGYFDNMSSNIMKTVGTVSLLALLRTKPYQFALGVISAIIVATTVYFYATNNKDNTISNATVSKNYIYPEVKADENLEQPFRVILSENNQPEVILFNPSLDSAEINKYISEYSSDLNFQKYLLEEYNKKVYLLTKDINTEVDSTKISLGDSKKLSDNNIEINNTDVSNKYNQKTALSAFELLPRDTCSEESIVLNAHFPGINSYYWSTGATTSEISVDKSGSYKITVELENGKKLSKSISVRIIPKPVFNSGYLVTACTGSILRLSVAQKNNDYKYYWPQYKLATPQMTVSKPGLYYAQVTGCQTYVDSFFVVFTHCELGIPNIVSPNGDGINETFTITNLNKYPNTELSIYDKNNKLIYRSNNYQNNWDASETPDGSYFYILKFADGTTQDGLITVKR